MMRLRLPDSFDHAVEDSFSPKITDRSRILLALDNRQPGDAMIKHGSDRHQRRIVESYIERIDHERAD